LSTAAFNYNKLVIIRNLKALLHTLNSKRKRSNMLAKAYATMQHFDKKIPLKFLKTIRTLTATEARSKRKIRLYFA
jgi:hypothetical protein